MGGHNMGNYATNTDLTTFKVDGSVIDLSEYTTAEMDAAINRSESYIEYVCSDIFYSKTETMKFDGNGNFKLFFMPQSAFALLTVTTCKEVDIDGTVLDTFVEETDFIKYDYYVETSRSYPNDSARRGVTRGGRWPKGQQNIEIVGTWGRSSVPEDIKYITTLLTIERLKPGTTKQTARDVKQVVWSDFTVTFTGNSDTENLTGFIEVDRILEKYVNTAPMFFVTPSEPFNRGFEL